MGYSISVLNVWSTEPVDIPRDACFPAHISLMSYVLQVIVIRVSPGIMFPRHRCADLQRKARWL